MATGVTPKNWTKDTHIINDEEFTGNVTYELSYEAHYWTFSKMGLRLG